MNFFWPQMFYLLPLPLLVYFLLPPIKSTAQAALRVPFYEQLEQMDTPAVGKWYSSLRLVFALLMWVLLVSAAARPQYIGEPVALPAEGRDLMMAVDISGSMEMPDLTLNNEHVTRLEVVKQVAGEFVKQRVGDRIGLILFGKRAYLQTPLTFDRSTVNHMLNESEIGLAGKETAIGDAIGLAVKRLRQQKNSDRVLILLTDGANTAGEVTPDQAARLAAGEGLKIYTVGIGADKLDVRNILGARGINSLLGPRTINPSADLDEDTLKNIARQTGGRYFRARDSSGLRDIYREIDRIEPAQKDMETFRPVRELFFWPLAFVLLVSLLLTAWRIFQSMQLDSATRGAKTTQGKLGS